MLFEISRASDLLQNEKPCDGAVPGGEAGTWFIEILDIESLEALAKREGQSLIVDFNCDPMDIKIYDGYVE